MTTAEWTVVALVVVPLIGFWLDLRHRGNQQHQENRDKLTRIETKVEPIWEWWTKTNGH